MAELLVVGYPEPETARRALETVELLQSDRVLRTAGAAIVYKAEDGHVGVTLPGESTGMGAAVGSTAGRVVGILFFMPIGGWLVGGAIGWLAGTLRDWGISGDFRAECAELLQPSSSALVVLVDGAIPDQAVAALQPLGGTVLRTSLSEDAERDMRQAFETDRRANGDSG